MNDESLFPLPPSQNHKEVNLFRETMADLAEDSWIILFIFIAAFALILSEKVHRTIAAWFGCVCLLIAGHARGMFNPCEEKVSQGSALPWRAGDGETVTVCTDSVSYTHLTLPTKA